MESGSLTTDRIVGRFDRSNVLKLTYTCFLLQSEDAIFLLELDQRDEEERQGYLRSLCWDWVARCAEFRHRIVVRRAVHKFLGCVFLFGLQASRHVLERIFRLLN